jgi:hypothetical protein
LRQKGFLAAEFASDLFKVATRSSDTSRDYSPIEFFNRTYLTEGLRNLIGGVVDRLSRRHWERARKVDINGNEVTISADSPLADAEWTKQHLSRATQALPNGYCGLPLQQNCPHANACLTYPVFITTPEFLPQHREQLELTRGIIERAQQRGQLRLVEMNQRTADNLTNIIGSLENDASTAELSENDAC